MALQVGSASAQLTLDYSGFTRGMDAVRKYATEIDRIRQEVEKPFKIPTPSAPTAPAIPKTPSAPSAPRNDDRAILARASAEARLAQASGDAAKAENILSTALARVDQSSLQAIRVQTQLVNIQNRLSDAKGPVTLPRTIDGITGSALKAVQGVQQLAQGFIALQGVQIAADLSKTAANAELITKRFDSLAQAAGTTGTALLTALRAASGNEIDDLNLKLIANKANLLGVARTAEEFSVLMAIARDRAQALGISTEQAFSDLSTGLGRGSALILDNLGILVNVTEANKIYAAQLGKNASALTDAEQKQALINQVIAQGRATIAATGGAVDSTAGSWARFGAAVDNAKLSLGTLINNFTPAISLLNGFSTALNFSQGSASFGQLVGQFFQLQTVFNPLAAGAKLVNDGVSGLVRSLYGLIGIPLPPTFNVWNAATTPLVNLFNQLTGQQQANTQATAQQTAVTQQATNATLQFQPGLQQQATATQQVTTATDAATAAGQTHNQTLAEQVQQSNAASAQAAQLAALQRDAQAAGIAAANGHGVASVAAANLASKYNIATIEAYRLIDAQAQLARETSANITKRAAAANRNTGFTGTTDRDETRAGVLADRKATQQARQDQAVKRAQEQLKIQETLLAAKGDEAAQIANIRQQQQYVNKDTQEYAQLQAKIINLQESPAKGGRGGGGGGVKLSDQQKLNNSLALDQMKFEDKYEDEAFKHEKKLSDIAKDSAKTQQKIWADYYAKRKQADAAFNQDSLDSRASFYLQLADVENAGLRENLSARYEQIVQDSQKISAEQGADAGQAYLDAATAALDKEAQIEAKIAELRSTKDKSKDQVKADASAAEYLEDALKLQQQADAARLQSVKDNGSQIANERDRQLGDESTKTAEAIADENLRYEEAYGTIAENAERSADRQVASAQLAGKAISETRTQVQGLQADYANLAGTPPPNLSAPTTPPPATGGTQAAAAALMAVKDSDLLAAVNAQTAMQAAKLDAVIQGLGDVRGEISRLRNSGQGLG